MEGRRGGRWGPGGPTRWGDQEAGPRGVSRRGPGTPGCWLPGADRCGAGVPGATNRCHHLWMPGMEAACCAWTLHPGLGSVGTRSSRGMPARSTAHLDTALSTALSCAYGAGVEMSQRVELYRLRQLGCDSSIAWLQGCRFAPASRPAQWPSSGLRHAERVKDGIQTEDQGLYGQPRFISGPCIR